AEVLPFIHRRSSRGVDGPECLLQGERVAEADVDVAVAPAQLTDHAHEPTEIFARFGRAALLGNVVRNVLNLIVGNRNRDQKDVFTATASVRIDDVREQAETRRQELAGARTTAFDVPFQRKALLDQVVDVLAQHQLVHRVVLEGAADEEDPATPK